MTSTNTNGAEIRLRRQQLGISQARLSELSKVPQHLLSSFELGKSELPNKLLRQLLAALADTGEVERIARRPKRYRTHEFVASRRLPEREQKCSRTAENFEYISLLDRLYRHHASSKQKPLSGLSLFAGCGGFSLGFSAAGFQVKGFLELEPELREIYRKNFPHALELGGDITEISAQQLQLHKETLGNIDVIIGGPPCQGFSLSGKRRIDDPRNTLFRHYLRFVDIFRPKVAIMENVRLLTSMKNPSGGLVKDEICREFSSHGYKVKFFELNAREYGVPQHRERVLFIATRSDIGISPSLPPVTHGVTEDLFQMLPPYRTFADACSDLPYIESGEASDVPLHAAVSHPKHVIDWLWDVPEGASAHENANPQDRPPSGYNTTYKRQIWKEPAATVQTTFGMISGCRNVHPVATRALTVREAARLQSFPDAYEFTGTLGAIRTGIGNAVPPLLAYVIAMHVRQRLSNFVKVPRLEVEL